MKRILNKEETIELHKRQTNGETTKALAEELSINPATLRRAFKRYNLKIATGCPEFRKTRLNCINKDYWKEIDSEVKAYILGFIYGDGNITGKNRVQIKMSKADSYILDPFINEACKGIELDKVNETKKRGVGIELIHFYINSDDWCRDLQKWGVERNKSLLGNLTFPNINKSLECHFIRGYFDANGSASTYKTTSNLLKSIAIYSTSSNLLNTISRKVGLPKKLYITSMKNCEMYKLQYKSQVDVEVVYSYLYNDATLLLSRKRDILIR